MDIAFDPMSSNWVLPDEQKTIKPTVPNYEEDLPIRVKQGGLQNYIKGRGTLNFERWEKETKQSSFGSRPPRVVGSDAIRNYTRARSSTPNLIYGNLDPPNPHHHMRVKKEGLDNYGKARFSHVKLLFENYGKTKLPEQTPLPSQNEIAKDLLHSNQNGGVHPAVSDYRFVQPSPRQQLIVKGDTAEHVLQKSRGVSGLLHHSAEFRPMTTDPHIKGIDAEMNFKKGHGNIDLLRHSADFRPPTVDPHVKGTDAHSNYKLARGGRMENLIREYGTLPLSARTVPKVKYAGIQNHEKAQGLAMSKIISQCPPSNRLIHRSQSLLLS